jgi:hypothetical protein
MTRLFASVLRAYLAHACGPESAYPHLAERSAVACIARDGER